MPRRKLIPRNCCCVYLPNGNLAIRHQHCPHHGWDNHMCPHGRDEATCKQCRNGNTQAGGR